MPLREMRDIARYWLEEFDWPARERELNQLSHFRAAVGGLRLHYIHMKSARPDARPLLLLHGWPGSFVEMLSILPPLTESFDVVVPSLPGYGFSDAPASAGMSNQRIADLLAELMTALGYERFAVQGGDWGAGIATWLALRFPSRVSALHLNYIPGSYAPLARALLPPPAQAAAATEPRLPREFSEALARDAASRTGEARWELERAADEARALAAELEELDAEIARLARDGDPEEAAHLARRLEALGAESAADGHERRQMRRLLAEQAGLLARGAERLQSVRATRAEHAMALHDLWRRARDEAAPTRTALR